ncbi:MAG: SDR family oxidoreductase [Acidobacteriota bacterium]|nr:SDR family oxidoreductase [Acidobacteriota bacterium]
MKNLTRTTATTIAIAILAIALSPAPQAFADSHTTDKAAEATTQKAVLVTGASTGIGRKITEDLAGRGIFVYAGARKDSDMKELNAIKNVMAIQLDVTIQDEIDAAVATITKEGRGLYALVNNAGVAVMAPLIEVEESELDFIFDVNIYGPYRITKAFSPLIIASKGRITTISSIAGILAGTMYGPYSMSKHAMEAYSDSLASEMQRFDVTVSVVEPGSYNSDISATTMKRMKKKGLEIEGSPYEKELRSMLERDGSRAQYKDPDEVADAVYHALFDENPKMRYMVVPNLQQAEMTIGRAMTEMVQLNQDQTYTFDRETLIKMLDESLAAVATPKTDD